MTRLQRVLCLTLLILSGAEALMPPALYLLYTVRMRGTGIDRMNRRIAVSEGRNPAIPPGMYRLRYWFGAFVLAGVSGAAAAALTLRGIRWAAPLLAFSLAVPAATVAAVVASFLRFGYRAMRALLDANSQAGAAIFTAGVIMASAIVMLIGGIAIGALLLAARECVRISTRNPA